MLHGGALPLRARLCADRPELDRPLARSVDQYLSLTDGARRRAAATGAVAGSPDAALPQFDGFQTIERLGAGGMGEVFKLRDLTLDRIVAGKVVRRDPRAPAGVGEFLREARSMALFADRRIVRIFEFRPTPIRRSSSWSTSTGSSSDGSGRRSNSRSAPACSSTSAAPSSTRTRSDSSIAT